MATNLSKTDGFPALDRRNGSACILDCDSPSFPPGWNEYMQCGCQQCAKDVRDKALKFLGDLHAWFEERAPEHYKGCGLWIDVNGFLRDLGRQNGKDVP